MGKYRILLLAIVACVAALSSQAWAAQEWTQTFYKGTQGPEYRGPWVVAIERLSTIKTIDKGYIPDTSIVWSETERSFGDDTLAAFWNPDRQWSISGLSMTNNIAAWLNPPSGLTRTIMYAVKQDFSSTGGVNNSDIMSIDESGAEALIKHGSIRYEPPYDTLGLLDPWGDRDTAISDFDYKDDLAPHRLYYDHVNAIYAVQGGSPTRTYNVISKMDVVGQSDEDMYFSIGKTGKFDEGGMLKYGQRTTLMWGTASGSGPTIVNGIPSYGIPTFDRDGAVSGEKFYSHGILISNNRWWGYVEIGTTPYWLYLQNADGTIRNYDASRYPEDPAFPGDPEKASGYPIAWHDNYELQLAYGYSLGVSTYGTSGRWVMERTQIYYWQNIQAPPHEADVMSETRTYNPYRNADGPNSPYEWLYDASGDMYTPLPGYTPRPDIADPELRRATELVAEVMGWASPLTQQTATSAPPNTTSKWQCYSTNGSSYWRWRTYDGRGTGQNHVNHPVYGGIDDSNQSGMNAYYNPTSLGMGGIPGVWYTVTEITPNLETFNTNVNNYDYSIGENINGGVVSQQYFEYAWKIAGKLLGDRFWEDGLVWSNKLGAVATRELVHRDFLSTLTAPQYLPNMTWDVGLDRWKFPTSYTSGPGTDNTSIQPLWGWYDHIQDTLAPGHGTLNDFMRYVMDIDALVVQDTNGNGVYDEETDYILFSLVDDGRFTKMPPWGIYTPGGGVGADTPYAGQYFSGETIFMYHNCEIVTYFDPATGIFFGVSTGTTYGATLWSKAGFYDLNALDIGLIPEPATALMLAAGAAALVGAARKRKIS